MSHLNECGELSEMGVRTPNDLVNFFICTLPINALNTIDVDWIGESIIAENITNFTFDHINQILIKTTNSNNLMSVLQNVVNYEEIVNVPNYVASSIVEDFATLSWDDKNLIRQDSTYSDIIEAIDTLCTAFILDEATTVALEFDIRSDSKVRILDRAYAYGLASIEMFTSSPHAHNVLDIEFVLRNILECLNAVKIRCIKTYNEELFITITYNNDCERSYYINLVAHACVSGCLFSA
jgi:hypothetical protein